MSIHFYETYRNSINAIRQIPIDIFKRQLFKATIAPFPETSHHGHNPPVAGIRLRENHHRETKMAPW